MHSLPTPGHPLLSQLPRSPLPAGSPALTSAPLSPLAKPPSKSLSLGATPFLTWVLNLEIPVRSQELPGPTRPAPSGFSGVALCGLLPKPRIPNPHPPLLTTRGPALTAPSSWKHRLPEHSSLGFSALLPSFAWTTSQRGAPLPGLNGRWGAPYTLLCHASLRPASLLPKWPSAPLTSTQGLSEPQAQLSTCIKVVQPPMSISESLAPRQLSTSPPVLP